MRGVLVQLRKDAGLNQAALAARLRITQSQVSKYERGERVLDETRLSAWASRSRRSIPRRRTRAVPARADAQVERNGPVPRSGLASSCGSRIQSST
jgi:transcriptional regulator with XRE-family HTH domain